MEKKRFLAAGGGLVLALGLGTGLSAAETTSAPPEQPAATTTMHTGDHDAMHEQMRIRMPDDLRRQCDAKHQQMGSGGMTAGMMGPATGS